MRPTQLTSYLQFAIANRFPVLIKGKPGIGKSDIVAQACDLSGARLIISHPVVSDPTDFKGLPFPSANGTEAHFLPFGDLKELINADKDTVFFMDDLGQAPPSVQAAAMQLILARRINGHAVSDKVTFLAATNRREDKAGVQGILEPVKSRFKSIVELEVNNDDWIAWAFQNNMPTELIAFIRFKPDLLNKFEASKEIVNSASPRTVAAVGHQQNAGLPKELEFEVFSGAAGEGFASEYKGFLQVFRNLPSIDQIIMNPKGTPVPTDSVATMHALAGSLAHHVNEQNIEAILTYAERMPAEYTVATLKDATIRHTKKDERGNKVCPIAQTRAYIAMASKFHSTIF